MNLTLMMTLDSDIRDMANNVTKTCSDCGKELPILEFNRHKHTSDGHINQCKACTKIRAAKHRANNIDKIRRKDRERGYRGSSKSKREYREQYPNKYNAHKLVYNAIRRGEIVKESCCICGAEERINAHHDNYLDPLNVRWLCSVHHHQWHKEHGEGKNAA